MAPAARDHGTPPVAAAATAALPFVAGADGVPRLPRISGAPPFTVKPEHNRAEFGRQLGGQEDGLNGLTVAAFLRNRDQYVVSGRSSAGTQAQKKARAKALRDKIEELREQQGLSRSDATTEAKQLLGTQAALHDPDQIAGGYAFPIAGMGDAAVNSSIGAQWPSRVAPIDKHVRSWAKNMSQSQRETTFLNVELPWN